MRIDCEQCSAAFTIDDALIPERGVRAQCPKCGHQRVVKRTVDAAADPFAAAGGAPAAPNPFAAAGGAPNPFAAAGAPANPFGAPANPFGAAPAAAPNPFGAAPAAAPNPFGAAPAAPAHPFGAAPATAPANPFGAAPAAAPTTPFGAAPAAAPANPFGAAPANPFGAAPAAAPANPFGAAPAAPANPFGAAPSAPANPFSSGAGAAASPFGSPAPVSGVGQANPFGGSGAAPAANPFGAAAAPAANPFGAPAASPFGAPAPSTNSFGPPGGANPFGAPAAGANPFGAPSANAGGAAPSPFGSPGAPPSNPFGGAPGSDDPFAGLSRGGAPPKPEKSPFGAPTTDSGPGIGTPTRPTAGPGQWTLEGPSGPEVLTVDELRDRIKAGAVRPDDLCAPAGESLKPAKEHGALATAFGTPKTIEKPRVAGARAAGLNISVPKPVMAAAAVAVLVVGGAFAVLKIKPELFEKQSDAGVNPLRRARPLWQRQFPDVEGTAQEHLVEGRKQMRLDTAAGYRKADDELRQALLLDIGSIGAIAAWAENFANLPTVRADLEGSTLAREAVEFGLKREPDNAELLRAQGALRLAQSNVDDAQRVLNKAKTISAGDIDTLMWLAKSHLERSPQDALSLVQREIRSKDPDLKVALTLEGAAQRRLGAFKEAREMLDARLVSDTANVGALKELAKLELDLGQADAALRALDKLLEAEDKDVEAHLLRAKITYQIKGGQHGLKAADQQLAEVLAKHEGAAGELLLSVLAHATFVKSRLGQIDAAIALGERARATDPAYPAALYTLGRAYTDKGDLENAKKTLEQAVRACEARDQFYEPLVRAELASVQAEAGDEQNAVRNNEKVIDYDPRNIRAHFSLASVFMKNGKASQANTILRRALTNDPAWERDRKVPTDYPTPPSDLVAFADVFAGVKSPDESLGSLRASAEGMIRYHAGEVNRSAELFGDALKLDRNNHAALLYLGLLELEQGRVADARKRFKHAVETTAMSHPVTRMYLARAELAAGDVEAARKRLQDLTETEPTLVQARYSLAMVLRSQKLEAQAKNELRAVVRQDPDYLPAKRALAEKM